MPSLGVGFARPSWTHQHQQLLPKLLTSGAVEEKVHRVICVHEHLGDRAGQLEFGGLHDGRIVPGDEGIHDEEGVHGQSGEQECEGDGEQHDSQLGAVLMTTAVWPVGTTVLTRPPRHRRCGRQPCALSLGHQYPVDDEGVEGQDDHEGQEGVDDGIHPRPDLLDQLLIRLSTVTLREALAIVGKMADLSCPEKVEV